MNQQKEQLTEYQKGIQHCIEVIKKRIERNNYASLNGNTNEKLLAPIRKDELETLVNYLASEKYH